MNINCGTSAVFIDATNCSAQNLKGLGDLDLPDVWTPGVVLNEM